MIGGQTVKRKSTTENWYVIFYIISSTLSGWAIANPAHPVNCSLHASVGCFRILKQLKSTLSVQILIIWDKLMYQKCSVAKAYCFCWLLHPLPNGIL